MARYEDDYDEEPKEQACFIATAAYGTPLSEKIDLLRQFRNEFLLSSPAGRRFVADYYRFSPPLAGFISRHRLLRAAIRNCLVNPVVVFLKSIRKCWSK